MENEVMNKFLELFGTSSKWGQSSQSNFSDYIINENKQLKAELQTLRQDAEKRYGELKREMEILRTRNRELEQNARLSTRSFVQNCNAPAPFQQSAAAAVSKYLSSDYINSNRRTRKRINVPLCIPTPLENLRHATSSVSCDNTINESVSVNSAMPVSCTTTDSRTRTVKCSAPTNDSASTNITATIGASAIPINVNTAFYGGTTVNDSAPVNDITSVNNTIPSNVTSTASVANVISPINGITSGSVISDITNPTEGYVDNYIFTDSNTTTAGYYPFVATPVSNDAYGIPVQKRTHRFRLPLTTARARKVPVRTATTNIYTPSLYDPMVMNISSDEGI